MILFCNLNKIIYEYIFTKLEGEPVEVTNDVFNVGATPCFKSICFFNCNSSKIFLFCNSAISESKDFVFIKKKK